MRSVSNNVGNGKVINVIKELKTDLKGDNESLRHEIGHLGQVINGKLDNLLLSTLSNY